MKAIGYFIGAALGGLIAGYSFGQFVGIVAKYILGVKV